MALHATAPGPHPTAPVLGRTRTPAPEGFYVCAFVRLVTLPDGRYNYGAPWEGYTDGTYTR
jgi:hypothetical protein